jgi:hypothetical protein
VTVTLDAACWLLLYTFGIIFISFNFGRLSTVGFPLRKAPRRTRMPQDASKRPTPTQDPTQGPNASPRGSQEVP